MNKIGDKGILYISEANWIKTIKTLDLCNYFFIEARTILEKRDAPI